MERRSGTRLERDSMGEVEVPGDAYYGASTRRAMLNFPISDLRMPRSFIRALGLTKLAAAKVNVELGLLDRRIGDAIAKAAAEVANGDLDGQFTVDVFQTGSGTSTNMNANEVIANRAAELLGGERGTRLVHPNDDVNLGQSSNDVIPTAIHLAALLVIDEQTGPALERLKAALDAKAGEFWGIIKTGRTHLLQREPFRGNLHAAHVDLCSAISQALDQRSELTVNFHSRAGNRGMEGTHVGHVQCLVIAGRDPDTADKRRSLDLFRNATKDVAVVTFDELLEKLRSIHRVMSIAHDGEAGREATTADEQSPVGGAADEDL